APEVVDDGENGVLTDVTVASLVETVSGLMADPGRLKRLRASIANRPTTNETARAQFHAVLTDRQVRAS
ncbi:MAG TPA: hypothetical protein VFK68_08095, partial [Propionibacteriaceae bacterium]|nr:hypothetical protein [Propionibacteriaceae bacterium]